MYQAQQPQFLGVCKVVVRCKYLGREKTYDKPVINFVSSTAEATGVLVITDPVVNVMIEVEEVSTSLLDDAIKAAFDAAEKAEDMMGEVETVIGDFQAHIRDNERHLNAGERNTWNNKLSEAVVEGSTLIIR